MKRILVPVDGSKFSEASLPTAIALAKRAGAALSLAMVGVPEDPPSGVWADAFRENHERYLEGLTERVEAQAGDGVDVSATLLDGAVVESLGKEIRSWEADLVVMTTHGRGGLTRAWLGSVADAVVRAGSAPTLLVRPGEDHEEEHVWADPLEVVVPVDGTHFAETALESATRLATLFDARVTLVRVVAYPYDVGVIGGGVVADYQELLNTAESEAREYLADLAERVKGTVPRVDTELLVSPSAAMGILDKAAEVRADVIVVSSHVRGGVSRLLLGSTADKLIRGAERSVLVVPPETTSTPA